MIPDDHEFVCLTLGPSVFGAEQGHRSHRMDSATIYFQSPVAIGHHWREWLGSVALGKLENTRLAFVASDRREPAKPASPIETIRAFEDRAYNALRALLIQGNPFEGHIAGLEVRRVLDAGRFREEAAFMRPRTAHPWEGILLINDGALATATALSNQIESLFARPQEFARLMRGLDHWDQATMEHRIDLRLHALVRAIEALLAPDRGHTLDQFVDRCKIIVKARQADRLLKEIYELRSQVEHSNDWRLAFQKTRPELSEQDAEQLAMLRTLQVEQIARRAYLRVLLDQSFLGNFRADESIRRFWKSRSRQGIWGARIDLDSEIERVFDRRKAAILARAKEIDRARRVSTRSGSRRSSRRAMKSSPSKNP